MLPGEQDTMPTTSVAQALAGLPRFPVERLAELALSRRMDTKFLFPAKCLGDFIGALGDHYGPLSAAEKTIASYQTLYFDTRDLTFFHQHHRGERARYKIRIRHYLDRELSYLEVKRKTNHNVTEKTRRLQNFLDDSISSADLEFLEGRSSVDPARIVPQVRTKFSRISLLGLNIRERITLDLGLEFEYGQQRLGLDGLAIIEVKQLHFSARSPAMLALRALGIRPSRVSKYCTALTTLLPNIRSNRFRPALRRIRRLTHV